MLDSVRQAALERDRASVVVTFFPHPSVVLGRVEPFYLTSTEEKIVLLNALGIDLVIIMQFTLEMSHMPAADYVSMLVEQLRMREVHVGYDFGFGYKREGNLEFLQRAGAQQGFEVHEVPELLNGGEAISSTLIRQALRAGDVQTAASWLGRPFRLSGTAVEAESHSTLPGMATVDLDFWQEHAVPANGRYACRAWQGSLPFKATVDIGSRQVSDDSYGHLGKPIRTVTARILDCDRDIYGANVALDFVSRLRGETLTTDPDARVAQMKSDVERTRELLVG